MSILDSDRMPAIIPLGFSTEYVPDPADPTKMKARDRVRWVKKGEGGNGAVTSEVIDRLRPDPARNRPAAIEWAAIEGPYNAWKAGEEMPVTGTPLVAWPGISRELADELRKFKIATVEDLADMPDHRVDAIPYPGVRDARRRAKAFKEAAGATDISDKLAERDRLIEAGAKEQAELRSMNDQLANELERMLKRVEDLEAKGGSAGEEPKADPKTPQRVSADFEMDPDAPPPTPTRRRGRDTQAAA